MKKKTKKIKIIISVVLLLVSIITATLVTFNFVKTSYMININTPSRIIVYYNKDINNLVFEKNSNEYNKIYSLVDDSHKQTILTSLFEGNLLKKESIEKIASRQIDFSGIKISFVYDTPQIVKFKNKTYLDGTNSYWYKTLVFDISSQDTFSYNTIAIISAQNSDNIDLQYTYQLQYLTFSNYNNLYKYSLSLF